LTSGPATIRGLRSPAKTGLGLFDHLGHRGRCLTATARDKRLLTKRSNVGFESRMRFVLIIIGQQLTCRIHERCFAVKTSSAAKGVQATTISAPNAPDTVFSPSLLQRENMGPVGFTRNPQDVNTHGVDVAVADIGVLKSELVSALAAGGCVERDHVRQEVISDWHGIITGVPVHLEPNEIIVEDCDPSVPAVNKDSSDSLRQDGLLAKEGPFPADLQRRGILMKDRLQADHSAIPDRVTAGSLTDPVAIIPRGKGPEVDLALPVSLRSPPRMDTFDEDLLDVTLIGGVESTSHARNN